MKSFYLEKTNKHGVHVIILDQRGLDLYNMHNWSIHKGRSTYYLFRNYCSSGKNKLSHFHRELLNVTSKTEIVDHINHNGLDNRTQNLRACSNKENIRNRLKSKLREHASVYKGVTWRKSRNKFQAQIKVNYKYIYLGCYECEIQAALAYNDAALKYFGNFANLNLITPTVFVD